MYKLRGEATRRAIRVCTYGACSAAASRESWLARADEGVHEGLAVFVGRA